ncbi:MAG: hypothetical protein KatS3mg059_1455 [Thermomicrobiales bacterium]|nr:MAG: hypothetical protein KatS3mg059_1455 [Thermomicrobiales bacterium]
MAVGAATKYDAESRPSFAASVYGEWWEGWIPAGAPPLFLTAASDDPLIAVHSNALLYAAWLAAGGRAELHLYAQGGHGFALLPQGLPSDGWIDRFWEWLQAEGLLAAHPRRAMSASRPGLAPGSGAGAGRTSAMAARQTGARAQSVIAQKGTRGNDGCLDERGIDHLRGHAGGGAVRCGARTAA